MDETILLDKVKLNSSNYIHMNSDILLINAPKNFWNNNKFFKMSLVNNPTFFRCIDNDNNILSSKEIEKLNIHITKINNYYYIEKYKIIINNFPDNIIDNFSNLLKYINYSKAIIFINEWDIHYRYFKYLFSINSLKKIIFVIPNNNKYKWYQESTITYLKNIIDKYGYTDQLKISYCINYNKTIYYN